MALVKFKIQLIFIMLMFGFCNNAIAQKERPHIAIQKPTTTTDIPRYLRKIFNATAFQNEIENAIQLTGKFKIISRNKKVLESIMDEQAFSDSEFSSGQAAEKGKIRAVNLKVLTEVQRFSFYRKSTAVPNISNKFRTKDSGSLLVSIKIVDTTTGAIERSFILKDGFSGKQKLSNKKGGLPHTSNLDRMFKRISLKMAQELIETVFPMQVIGLKGNSIFISMGKVKKGEKLIVFSAGEALIDPYTGESLGSAEEELGVLKVTRVKPKSLVATPIDKSLLDQISIGDIVRKK